MGNSQWYALFPPALISRLVCETSDRALIILDLVGGARVGPKLFKFESFWTKDEHSKAVVRQAW